jgi:hypothetical protein
LGIQCTIKSIRYAKIFYKKRKEKKKQIRGQLSCVKFRKSGINGWAAILSSPEKAPIQLLLAEKKKKKKLNHCQLLQNANTYFYSLYNFSFFFLVLHLQHIVLFKKNDWMPYIGEVFQKAWSTWALEGTRKCHFSV